MMLCDRIVEGTVIVEPSGQVMMHEMQLPEKLIDMRSELWRTHFAIEWTATNVGPGSMMHIDWECESLNG